MARKPKFQKFEVPNQFLEKLYEMSGNIEKNKGYFLAYIDEDGNGQIKHKYDSQATEFAIMKFIEVYHTQYEGSHEIQLGEDFHGENEDDD